MTSSSSLTFPYSTLPARGFKLFPLVDLGGGKKPVSGPPQIGNLSAGFRWGATYDPRVLHTSAHHKAWRMLLAKLMTSTRAVDVPIVTGFAETAVMTLAAGAAINAVSISAHLTSGAVPTGGEWFCMIGSSGLARAHLIHAVASTGSGNYTLSIVPELREAYSSSQALEFIAPVCAMAITPDSLEAAWPYINERPFRASPSAKFEEWWPENIA